MVQFLYLYGYPMRKAYILLLSAIFTLTACAQEHKKNETRLNTLNKIISNTVLLNNQNKVVPLLELQKKNIASVNLGFSYQHITDSLLNKYARVTSFTAERYKDAATLNELEDDLKYFNTVVVMISAQQMTNSKYMNFVQTLAKSKQVIIGLFGPSNNFGIYNLSAIPTVWSKQSDAEAATIIPQVIFGGIGIGGSYPTRLKYTLPEDAGVNADDLLEIDNIAMETITERAAPGLVVLVAKDGKVIFNKAYGNHTYNDGMPDRISDIFDLASLTKTTATTPTVMRLVEEQKLNLDTNIGAYIPKARTTAMSNIAVREVMLHQAGFIPYIPFQDAVKATDHSADSSSLFPTKVADGYYIRKDYFNDVMWPRMLNAPIKTRGKYVYSDISMYVMKDIVERISGKPLNEYVQENFYAPLGMQTAGFLPRNRFSREQIIPTENDTYFRKTLLVGYVHDQGAALVGGVSGHAGLFASANDVAIMYQMLLNRGSYGGMEYFHPQTVDQFTARQSDVSRRGLGFDRWDPMTSNRYPADNASPQTYGHTGYTGTCVWVDPTRGLVYVFLSNRVNPTVSEKLGKLRIRARIQEVINKAIDKGIK